MTPLYLELMSRTGFWVGPMVDWQLDHFARPIATPVWIGRFIPPGRFERDDFCFIYKNWELVVL